jgi:hypothetical protein
MKLVKQVGDLISKANEVHTEEEMEDIEMEIEYEPKKRKACETDEDNNCNNHNSETDKDLDKVSEAEKKIIESFNTIKFNFDSDLVYMFQHGHLSFGSM